MPSILLVLIPVLMGCGRSTPRRVGDPDGVPVQFVVELESGYAANISSPSGDVGWYDAWPYDPFYRPYGHGFRHPHHFGAMWHGPMWHGPGPTGVNLLGGDGPVQAQVFRRELDRGINRFQIPIRAGHVVTLTVQVMGGRQGWESVGTITGSGLMGQSVDLRLRAAGPTVTVSGPATAPP